jgi:hypothetical protein
MIEEAKRSKTMSVDLDPELARFNRFVAERIGAGNGDMSPEEALDLWRAENPAEDERAETVRALSEALEELQAGDPVSRSKILTGNSANATGSIARDVSDHRRRPRGGRRGSHLRLDQGSLGARRNPLVRRIPTGLFQAPYGSRASFNRTGKRCVGGRNPSNSEVPVKPP